MSPPHAGNCGGNSTPTRATVRRLERPAGGADGPRGRPPGQGSAVASRRCRKPDGGGCLVIETNHGGGGSAEHRADDEQGGHADCISDAIFLGKTFSARINRSARDPTASSMQYSNLIHILYFYAHNNTPCAIGEPFERIHAQDGRWVRQHYVLPYRISIRWTC